MLTRTVGIFVTTKVIDSYKRFTNCRNIVVGNVVEVSLIRLKFPKIITVTLENISVVTMGFGNVSSESGLSALNQFLQDKSYIVG